MRVFIGEFVCGGGFASTTLDQIPSSLRVEGAAMHAALCRDAADFAEVVTTVDKRFGPHLPASIDVYPIHTADSLCEQWLTVADRCDAAILIAPESEGLLRSLVAAFRTQSRAQVIAPDDEFIAAAADKFAFARWMRQSGVSHPLTIGADDSPSPLAETGWIVKPCDGCGSDAVRYFDAFEDAAKDCSAGPNLRIIQPRHLGVPVSISAIVGKFETAWLPACRQSIDPQSYAYQGGSSPLGEPLQRRAQRLASAAIAGTPGVPRGYIGVDLLLGESPAQDIVIEVNPRLTTSYLGLSQLLRSNLAARMLGVERGALDISCLDEISWNSRGLVHTVGR